VGILLCGGVLRVCGFDGVWLCVFVVFLGVWEVFYSGTLSVIFLCWQHVKNCFKMRRANNTKQTI